MALSLAQSKTYPPIIIFTGEGGLGKTTAGTQTNAPVFIPLENGLVNFPTIPRFPQPKTFVEFLKYLAELATEVHDRKTLVIDSLDRLESLIWDHVCRENHAKNIEEVNGGYGKGLAAALEVWREYIAAIDYLNKEKDMTIFQIAHTQIKRYDSPLTQGYDRYTLKLQDGKSVSAAALLFEHADIVMFVNSYVGITKDVLPGSSKKNPKEHARGIGSGERILYTQERPAFRAKSRFPLPDEIPFDEQGEYWNIIKSAIPYYTQKTGA